MWQKFCAWMLYKRMGWSKDINQPHPNKYIICLAHTPATGTFSLASYFLGLKA